MGRIRRSTKALSVDIYERSDGRYHVVSKDETGERRYTTRFSLSDAKKLQSEKIANLERHRGGRFNLDDREMLSQARDLASSHGYTVLQAIQEWHSSKGSSKAIPLGEVIEKFLAAKSNRSAAKGRRERSNCFFGHIKTLSPPAQEAVWTQCPSGSEIGTGIVCCIPENEIGFPSFICRVRLATRAFQLNDVGSVRSLPGFLDRRPSSCPSYASSSSFDPFSSFPACPRSSSFAFARAWPCAARRVW